MINWENLSFLLLIALIHGFSVDFADLLDDLLKWLKEKPEEFLESFRKPESSLHYFIDYLKSI